MGVRLYDSISLVGILAEIVAIVFDCIMIVLCWLSVGKLAVDESAPDRDMLACFSSVLVGAVGVRVTDVC